MRVAMALFDALDRHDLSGFAGLFDPDFKGQRTGNRLLNLDECRRFWQGFLDACPDLKVRVLDTFEKHYTVAVRWRCTGTQRFPLPEVLGNPPIAATHRAFILDGTLILEIRGACISRSWNYFDRLGLMEQLGLLKAPSLRQ